jgi:hypothetical protein
MISDPRLLPSYLGNLLGIRYSVISYNLYRYPLLVKSLRIYCVLSQRV